MSRSKMTETMSGNASMSSGATAPESVAPSREQFPTAISVKIHSIRTSGSVLAHASVDLNGVFAIRGVKVVDSENGPFVSMPSYKAGGEYRDICFPVTKEFREQLNGAVLGAYQQEMSQLTQKGQNAQSFNDGIQGPTMTM